MNKQTKAILDEEYENSEAAEWDEYHRRKRMKQCTCDLLSPFGHVTCPSCNESLAGTDLLEELGL